MPLYMDRHYVEGATRSAVAHAHQLDLAVQEKYKVQFLTYWFDEPRCTAFCLIVSPDKETGSLFLTRLSGPSCLPT